MQQLLSRISILFFFIGVTTLSSFAQDTSQPTSVDPTLLGLENSRIPKEYTVSSINITGANYLDTAVIASISGLQVGDKVQIPGGDAFSKAIANLWRQRLFSNIQIFITGIQEDRISLEINVQERPKLGNFNFIGIKKSEAEELQRKNWIGKINHHYRKYPSQCIRSDSKILYRKRF